MTAKTAFGTTNSKAMVGAIIFEAALGIVTFKATSGTTACLKIATNTAAFEALVSASAPNYYIAITNLAESLQGYACKQCLHLQAISAVSQVSGSGSLSLLAFR